MTNLQIESCLKGYPATVCCTSSMSPFEVVQAMQSAGVGVVGLDLSRTVVVLRSVDVGETAVIRFPTRRHRHLRTALPVLLQTETSRNEDTILRYNYYIIMSLDFPFVRLFGVR
jgi:hypothetical protein